MGKTLYATAHSQTSSTQKTGRSATRQTGPYWQVLLALLFCFYSYYSEAERPEVVGAELSDSAVWLLVVSGTDVIGSAGIA